MTIGASAHPARPSRHLRQEKDGRAAAYPNLITVASHTKKDNPAGLPSRPSSPQTALAPRYVLITKVAGQSVWRSLIAHNPAAAPQVLAILKAREAKAARLRTPVPDSREIFELDARSLVSLREVVYLGGYVPESAIRAGERYDVRFLEESAALWVADPNPRAQGFYRKHGFAADGTARFVDGVREIRMVRGVQHSGTGRGPAGV